jgi:putative phosphoesterase
LHQIFIGSSYYCEKIKEVFDKINPDRLVLLGDLLYHGPRNDLPQIYNTKKTAEILNSMKDKIICVRGNCDSEVDQMVLEFPIMSDYSTIYVDNRVLFVTHGHIYHKNNLPNLQKNDILIHGHTHVQTIERHDDYTYINPGSVSLPKENNPNTYMTYENNQFKILDFHGNMINEMTIK